MKWVFLALLIFLVILLLILFTNIKVFIDYYHGQDNDHLRIKFTGLFGLVQYKLNIPLIKVDNNSPSLVVKKKTETGKQEKDKKKEKKQYTVEDLLKSYQDSNELLRHVAGLYKIVRKFLSKLTVESLDWHTVIGIGDAAYTGILVGAFWTVKGSLLGLMSALMKVKRTPQIMITPNFQSSISQTSLQCMIRFRVGHAIFVGIKLIKYWKGGSPNFKTKPLSVLSQS